VTKDGRSPRGVDGESSAITRAITRLVRGVLADLRDRFRTSAVPTSQASYMVMEPSAPGRYSGNTTRYAEVDLGQIRAILDQIVSSRPAYWETAKNLIEREASRLQGALASNLLGVEESYLFPVVFEYIKNRG
jgi:hypothetical protein